MEQFHTTAIYRYENNKQTYFNDSIAAVFFRVLSQSNAQ